MTLGAALNIGKSGLLASQTALTVTGNNLANLATPGYNRQRVSLAPAADRELANGQYLGQGVLIESITRVVDEALNGRLRAAIGQEAGSTVRQELMSQIEAIQNEFTDADLSTRLQSFFNAWSQAANNPQDLSLRTLVAQESSSLANYVQDMRSSLTDLQVQVGDSIGNAVDAINDLLTRIEGLNNQISRAESGANGPGSAHGLRDQRDVLLGELSEYLDISTVEQPSGSIDVFVGSLPIVLNGESRGVDLRNKTVDGEVITEVIIEDDGSVLDVADGQIGAYVQFRNGDLMEALNTLDTFANQLIFQVNRLHSQGQPLEGYSSITSTTRVDDATVALNDASLELDFTPQHGSFLVHVTQKSTGERVTSSVSVDLDGINPAGDTTLTSLVADLDGIANVSATINGDGTITLSADAADFEVTFSEDSSGMLAVLGIGTFFKGADATDIAVHDTVFDPNKVAMGLEHLPGDNRTALAIAGLRDTPVGDLDGLSLTQYWDRHIEDYAIRLAQTRAAVDADTLVRQSLETQQQALSGVNADEEAINLMSFQRAYQANARFIGVVDELMQTLISLV